MTSQRLLIDACLPRAVAERLRAEGHDVVSVRDQGADPGDAVILESAANDGRSIVTIDTDFGALVFRDGANRVGVLRLRQARAAALAERASLLIAAHGDELKAGAFVTDDGDQIRVNAP